MLAKFTLLSFVFLLSIQAQSQNKTFEGYYLGKGGDTVKGAFINYTQWSKSPSKVTFVPYKSATQITLTPDNCREFNIQNFDTYLSFAGPRMINSIDYNEVMNNKDTFGFPDQFAGVSAFVRLIGKTGNLKIYSLKDDLRTNFFYQLSNESLQELKFKMYLDQNRVIEVFEFRQQLNNILKDEIGKRKIAANLEKVVYTEESLSDLTEKLTPAEKRNAKVKNPASGLVIAAGVSVNSFKVTGENTVREVGINYKTSFSPIVSIGYISAINRNFNRYFVNPHLNLFSYKNTGEIIDATFKRITTYKTSGVVSPVINVGVNLINSDKKTFFISAGAGMYFLMNNKEQQQIVSAANNNPYQSSETKLSSLTYNVNVATGFTLNRKLITTATYNLPVPTANFVYYTPFHSSIQVTIGYKL